MKENPKELRRQVEALEERVARLSVAVVRISSTLDLDTVLQEVVDSARALTGALYGVIVTVDGTGHIEEFVTSGFTADEKAQMAAWSDGPRFFAHFRDLAEPLRLADLPALRPGARLLVGPDAVEDAAGTPLRAPRRVRLKLSFSAKAGGQEFTSADERVATVARFR